MTEDRNRSEPTLQIGEVAERTGVTQRTLRFYEEQGLIRSERNSGGHRRYTRPVIRRVAFIVFAQRVGLSLEEIGGELAKLPAEQRAGLLTQASLLTARAHASENSWVHRGKFVREALLCDPLPPPPPGVDANKANDPNRLTNPECMGCHQRMDPIGLGFERYDAIGAFDESATADGELLFAGDLSGPFASSVDLASRLAASDVVRQCISKYVFHFASHRAETDRDVCSLEAADAAFVASKTTLAELFVAIARSDAFRYRRTSP